MIKIEERKPNKITGNTSLFLSFDYNKDIINQVKQEPLYLFDDKTKEWELPITSLASLLDNLTYLDDIKLKLYKEKEIEEDNKLTIDYRTKPFNYQLDGIKYGLSHDKWLLLDAPGLGKSLQIIYLAEELHKQRGLKHCLIVCGVASLRANWKNEIEKHSNLSCRIIGEKVSKKGNSSYALISDRAKELKDGIEEFFIITNIESFRDKKEQVAITKGPNKGKFKDKIYCPILDAFNDSKEEIDMIVIDEVHKCKDPNSQQSKNFIKLKSKYKIAATGTLLLNNPLEAYIPLYWTENEHSNYYNFKNEYCVYGGFGGNQIVGFKNISLLKDEIDSCSLRRTKDLLDLPEKTIINEYIELDDTHKDFYNNVVRGVKEECDKIELKANNILALTTRLRQASVLPSILTTQNIKSTKIERAVDLIYQLVSNKEKVVVMSTFKDSVLELAKNIRDLEPLICIGDTKDSDINKYKDYFQNDNEHYVMLCTWQKMGTGHTLNRASYMIFLDTPWTAGVYEQACDRIHRIGSKNPVFIYNLVAKETFDEKVVELLEKKKAISDYMIDDSLDENTLEILKRYIKDL